MYRFVVRITLFLSPIFYIFAFKYQKNIFKLIMKRNYRKAALLLAGFTFAFTTWAQEISLKTKDTQIKVDEQGNYSSIQVCGKEILQ